MKIIYYESSPVMKDRLFNVEKDNSTLHHKTTIEVRKSTLKQETKRGYTNRPIIRYSGRNLPRITQSTLAVVYNSFGKPLRRGEMKEQLFTVSSPNSYHLLPSINQKKMTPLQADRYTSQKIYHIRSELNNK